MRIYPEKGANPAPNDFYELAAAALKFGLAAVVGREKTKSGYRKYVEIVRPVEFGIKNAAPELEPPRAAQEK